MNHRNETMTKKQVSAKQLGELALPYNCRRCFWIKSALKGKLPSSPFRDLQFHRFLYQEDGQGWFERHGEAPEWVGGMGELKKWIAPPGAKNSASIMKNRAWCSQEPRMRCSRTVKENSSLLISKPRKSQQDSRN